MWMLSRFTGIIIETGRSIAPVIALLLIFQFLILRKPLYQWREITIGLLFTAMGLIALMYGLRHGVLPMGTSVANSLIEARNIPLILAFSLCVGLAATYAEPALLTLADQMAELTAGAMNRSLFVNTVALGVGLGTVVGTSRILFGIAATDYFIPLLAMLLVLTYFAPEKYTSIAFDAALATTGPLTVTLIVALGAGLAAALGRGDVLLYGFGLVTTAAIGPIITVLLLGIVLGRIGL
jgi:hypothetical protein